MERHFQNTWAIKFPWVELVVGTRLKFLMHHAWCKICMEVECMRRSF
jgi:hypothetical protein